MKYMKLFPDHSKDDPNFNMLEDIKEIFYILKDEGVVNIKIEKRVDTSDTWGVDWDDLGENETPNYGTEYRLYIETPKKPKNKIPRGIQIVKIGNYNSPKDFHESQAYLEFLDRCTEICKRNNYLLEYYDGDCELGYESDIIFEMTPN